MLSAEIKEKGGIGNTKFSPHQGALCMTSSRLFISTRALSVCQSAVPCSLGFSTNTSLKGYPLQYRNIIKSAKISRFLLKSVRDFNEFHTPRAILKTIQKVKGGYYVTNIPSSVTEFEQKKQQTLMIAI